MKKTILCLLCTAMFGATATFAQTPSTAAAKHAKSEVVSKDKQDLKTDKHKVKTDKKSSVTKADVAKDKKAVANDKMAVKKDKKAAKKPAATK